MFKNVAAKFMVFAFDATTNVPKTGDAANITAYVSKDYGTVTVLADTGATEMDATNAPGYYLFDAAQGETNGDVLMVSGKSATANIKVIGAPAVIFTRPTTGWLAPTTAGRTLDVSANGEAGVDWANVGGQSTAVNLSATTTNLVNTVTTYTGNTVQTGDSYAIVNSGTHGNAAIKGYVDDIGTAGAGLTALPWNAAWDAEVQSEVDDAINAQDLPTNTELTTALGTADDAVLAAIAALNNLSQANIRTAVGLGSANLDTQLAAIAGFIDTEVATIITAIDDLPTNAELTAALGTADDSMLAQIALVKAKTDSLTFTVAGVLDAHVRYVHSVEVGGAGTSASPWGPA